MSLATDCRDRDPRRRVWTKTKAAETNESQYARWWETHAINIYCRFSASCYYALMIWWCCSPNYEWDCGVGTRQQLLLFENTTLLPLLFRLRFSGCCLLWSYRAPPFLPLVSMTLWAARSRWQTEAIEVFFVLEIHRSSCCWASVFVDIHWPLKCWIFRLTLDDDVAWHLIFHFQDYNNIFFRSSTFCFWRLKSRWRTNWMLKFIYSVVFAYTCRLLHRVGTTKKACFSHGKQCQEKS